MELALANEEFFQLNRKKIKPQHKELLMALYKWTLSDNPPISKYANGKKWYLINFNYISKSFETGYMNIRNHFKRLCGDSKNDIPFIYKKIEKVKSKGYLSYAWISINKDIAKEALDKESNEYKSLFTNKIRKRNKMSDALFDIDEEKKYPEESIAIANKILYKYNNYFSHRIPNGFGKSSKTYDEILRKITDIYNGSFTNPRVYSFNDNFLSNNSFYIDGWRDKIKEVKGNWCKVNSLIMNALKNFDTMHLPNYMPFSKKYLQTNLSLWFYDEFNGQSQFIQSLSEPETTSRHVAELKADRIFNRLPSLVEDAGNNFKAMNSEMGNVTLWENMKKMTDWAKAVFDCDYYGAIYWASSYVQIPMKFYNYCKENNIKVNTTTIDIEKAVDFNSPWSWFVQKAIEKHGLNKDLVNCKTAKDVYDLYDRDIPF